MEKVVFGFVGMMAGMVIAGCIILAVRYIIWKWLDE